jgi:hypothetical protein
VWHSAVDTGAVPGKFAAAVVLIPEANLPWVSTTSAVNEISRKDVTAGDDTGSKFAAGVIDSNGKFATTVVDINGSPSLANISVNFRKNLN